MMVTHAAQSLWKGVKCVTCGSYRRGKPSSGDVDVLITHPESSAEKGGSKRVKLLNDIIKMLQTTSPPFITGVLGEVRATTHQQASFMGYCQLPPGHPQHSGVHRRLDIKVYPIEHFPFALLYFTGSDHFNRSMRHYAKMKQWTLSDHGLAPCRRQHGEKIWTGKSVYCRTEEEIFEKMGLTYVPPTERNTFQNYEVGAEFGDAHDLDGRVVSSGVAVNVRRRKYKQEEKGQDVVEGSKIKGESKPGRGNIKCEKARSNMTREVGNKAQHEMSKPKLEEKLQAQAKHEGITPATPSHGLQGQRDVAEAAVVKPKIDGFEHRARCIIDLLDSPKNADTPNNPESTRKQKEDVQSSGNSCTSTEDQYAYSIFLRTSSSTRLK